MPKQKLDTENIKDLNNPDNSDNGGDLSHENLNPDSSEIDMDSLTEGETFPEVKENAIQAVNEAKAKEEAEAKKLELEGVRLKKDGTPAKKRGRKSKDEKPSSGFVHPDENILPVSKSRDSAIVISGLLEQMQVTLISDEFKYLEHERGANILAWQNTLDYYGGVEISPPVALALSHASIILTRANQEKTKTKFELAKAWVKNKIANFKTKKDKQDAHTHTGAHNVGKDDVRQEESPKP